MKKILTVIIIGVIILLAGCGAKPENTPTSAPTPALTASETPTQSPANKAAVISRDLPDGVLAKGTAVLALEKAGEKWKVAPMSVGEPPIYWGDVDEQYLSFDAAEIAALSNYGIVKTETTTYDEQGNAIGSYGGAVLIQKRDGDMFLVVPGPGGPDSVWIKAESVSFEWGD